MESSHVVPMALGEKLFEETGKILGVQVESVHPVEGVKMQVSFASEIKGLGKVPSGKNLGSGTATQYPHGAVNASYRGVASFGEGDQYIWWAHEKSRAAKDGMIRGVVIVSGYTNSQKLSWMNGLIIVIETENDASFQQFKGTAYEWK
jgi:hypothetical protein